MKKDKAVLGNDMTSQIPKEKFPDNDELLTRIKSEYDAAFAYRQTRVASWNANEDLLYGKKPPTLTNRSNILIQLMAGFEDTLLAKINSPVIVNFSPVEEGDVMKAKRVTSFFEFERSPQREDWEQKDLLTKKLAMVSGRALFKIYTAHPYKHKLDPVDHYDFLIDPLTSGLSLETARYLGQDNIIKSKADLERNTSYDKKKVKELIDSYAEETSALPDNQNNEKQHRLNVQGFDIQSNYQAGDSTYKLLEWYTHVNGVRYYFLLDLEKKIIIKQRKLEELTPILSESNVPCYPFESWAYYPDLFNFWSPSPMDRVRELFILRNVALNQLFDNNEAINKPMRIYDPNTFKNPALLKYTPDALVPVSAGKDPQTGIHTLQTQAFGTGNAKEMAGILEDLAAKITGVTPAGMGMESSTEKVGIYYGNMQEVEKRMLQFEASYSRCHMRLAQKYLGFLSERLSKAAAVKILGAEGAVIVEQLTNEDLVKFDVEITGGLSAARQDAISKKLKMEFLNSLHGNPAAHPMVVAELTARLAGLSEIEIKRLLAQQRKDEKQIVKAAEDLQKLMEGETVAPYPKADTTYLQEIVDFLLEHKLTEKEEQRVTAYFESLQEIVTRNMILKAHLQAAESGMLGEAMGPGTPGPVPGPDTGAPLPDSIGGANMQTAGTIPSVAQETYGQV